MSSETGGSESSGTTAALGRAAGRLSSPLPRAWKSLRKRLALRRWLLAWTLSLNKPFKNHLMGRPLTRAETGLAGELLAARWLKKQGRKVLYRNHRSPYGGEVDIVARHGRVLAFVEVKTRSREDHGRPADAVNEKKRQLIRRGAEDWLRLLNRPQVRYRFDVVEVYLIPGQVPRLHVQENAFGMPDSSLSGR